MSSLPKFEYETVDLESINFEIDVDPETKQRIIHNMTVGGEHVRYTDRFGISLCSLYGFSKSIYNLYEPYEVIERIIDKELGRKVRITRQKQEGRHDQILAVSRPEKPILKIDDLVDIFDEVETGEITYNNGILSSTHKPAAGNVPMNIGGDEFKPQFVLDIPVDGYGLPSIYISLLRMICENGMIAMSKDFKSTIKLSQQADDPVPQVTRFLNSFNNEEGYAALRDRLEAALKSPASLNELFSLAAILDKDEFQSIHTNTKLERTTEGDTIINSDQTHKLKELGGEACDRYGLISLDAISEKKRRRIPTNSTMYNLISFATELGTHFADTNQNRILQTWVGQKVTQEYDLENTLEAYEQPEDLFLINK